LGFLPLVPPPVFGSRGFGAFDFRTGIESKLEDPAEVDSRLVTWIKRAYSLTT